MACIRSLRARLAVCTLMMVLAPWVWAAALSEATHRKLTEIHNQLAEEQYSTAVQALEQLMASVSGDGYATAVVAQTLGYAHLGLERPDAAIAAFETAIAQEQLPAQPTANLLYTLAQLHLAEQRPERALKYLDRWFALLASVPQELAPPTPEGHLLHASILLQLKQTSAAATAAARAIDLKEDPPASWYQLLLACHFEHKDYPAAVDVLKRMLLRWPDDPRYWRQLASLYLALEQDQAALATYFVAQNQNMLEGDSDFLNLVRLAVHTGVPERGARVLQEALVTGGVASTPEHWELLGNAWYQAKELGPAIAAFARAAEQGKDGRLYLRIARLEYQQGHWAEAAQAAGQALGTERFGDRGQAHLLIGLARYELGEFDAAKAALLQAAGFAATKARAEQWLSHLERTRSERTS